MNTVFKRGRILCIFGDSPSLTHRAAPWKGLCSVIQPCPHLPKRLVAHESAQKCPSQNQPLTALLSAIESSENISFNQSLKFYMGCSALSNIQILDGKTVPKIKINFYEGKKRCFRDIRMLSSWGSETIYSNM